MFKSPFKFNVFKFKLPPLTFIFDPIAVVIVLVKVIVPEFTSNIPEDNVTKPDKDGVPPVTENFPPEICNAFGIEFVFEIVKTPFEFTVIAPAPLIVPNNYKFFKNLKKKLRFHSQ
jgi:hypothetical protein